MGSTIVSVVDVLGVAGVAGVFVQVTSRVAATPVIVTVVPGEVAGGTSGRFTA